MPRHEPNLSDLAKLLGISQLAAQRHERKHGKGILNKAWNVLSNVLAGSRRGRQSVGQLPPELIDVLNRMAGGSAQPPAPPPAPPGAPPIQPGGFRSRSVPRVVGRLNQPPTQEELSEWSSPFRTPTSSNVYEFRFHRPAGSRVGTLEITYKAVHLNSEAISRGTVKRGKGDSMDQLIGTAGKTVRGGARPDSPGAVYHYFKIPQELFTQMKAAWSKGKFTWDRLRVRGDIGGARYQYQLMSGQVSTELGASYIPRRATNVKGAYRTRSLAEIGSGRRSFLTSTLPPTSRDGGFSTRSKRK